MKKIIFLALVALLGIHTVDAQRRGGTRENYFSGFSSLTGHTYS